MTERFFCSTTLLIQVLLALALRESCTNHGHAVRQQQANASLASIPSHLHADISGSRPGCIEE